MSIPPVSPVSIVDAKLNNLARGDVNVLSASNLAIARTIQQSQLALDSAAFHFAAQKNTLMNGILAAQTLSNINVSLSPLVSNLKAIFMHQNAEHKDLSALHSPVSSNPGDCSAYSTKRLENFNSCLVTASAALKSIYATNEQSFRSSEFIDDFSENRNSKINFSISTNMAKVSLELFDDFLDDLVGMELSQFERSLFGHISRVEQNQDLDVDHYIILATTCISLKYKAMNRLLTLVDEKEELVSNLDQNDLNFKSEKKSLRKMNIKLSHLQQSIVNCEQNFVLGLNTIYKHSALSELPIKFSNYRYALPLTDQEIDLFKEILTQKLKNISLYLHKINALIDDKKDEILSKFFGIQGADNSKVSFKLQILGDESHNQGQSPIKVTFYVSDAVIGCVVYKPRSAISEIAIIELFNALNDAAPLGTAKLDVYQIVSLNDSGSIWEFIEGLALPYPAYEYYLQKLHLKAELKHDSDALKNLERLQKVSKLIGLIDLHQENVIFKEKGNRWVPIDLEIIKRDHVTDLYSFYPEPELPLLTISEMHLINEFNQTIEQRLIRSAPVHTNVFKAAANQFFIEGSAKLVNQLMIAIMEEFALIVSFEKLKQLVDQDLYNGDVPFFTEQYKNLFYGTSKNKIAIRKGG